MHTVLRHTYLPDAIVVGSLKYAHSRVETKDKGISLLSRCMGGNAMVHAMTHFPDFSKDVKAMAFLQAVSGHAFVEKGARNLGLDVTAVTKEFDRRIHDLTRILPEEAYTHSLCEECYRPDPLRPITEGLIDRHKGFAGNLRQSRLKGEAADMDRGYHQTI